jgi:hypothetical protein
MPVKREDKEAARASKEIKESNTCSWLEQSRINNILEDMRMMMP